MWSGPRVGGDGEALHSVEKDAWSGHGIDIVWVPGDFGSCEKQQLSLGDRKPRGEMTGGVRAERPSKAQSAFLPGHPDKVGLGQCLPAE